MTEFFQNYLEEHGIDSVDTIINASLDAIEQTQGNQDKVNWHLAVIRHARELEKGFTHRVKVLANQEFQTN